MVLARLRLIVPLLWIYFVVIDVGCETELGKVGLLARTSEIQSKALSLKFSRSISKQTERPGHKSANHSSQVSRLH
jgi:hypothetical protein